MRPAIPPPGRPGPARPLSLIHIWTFDTALQEPFRHNHVLNKEKCRDCWARFFCSGGCAANAWHQNGDISKPYDMECQIERKRVECALALKVLEERA